MGGVTGSALLDVSHLDGLRVNQMHAIAAQRGRKDVKEATHKSHAQESHPRENSPVP